MNVNMKQICAVWMAALRPLIGKLAGLLFLLAAAETALVQWVLRTSPQTVGSFCDMLQFAHVAWVFLAALALLCAALCLQGCQLSGGKMGYTLGRLPLRETAVTGLWALAHMGCIVILWAWQLALVCLFWRWYGRALPEGMAPNLLLAVSFYNSGFLHSLLPLADVLRHVRNVLWVLSMGAATASFGFFQRRDRGRGEALFLMILGMWNFRMGINGGMDFSFAVIGVIVLVCMVRRMWEVRWDED